MMANYQKILLATDFSESKAQPAARARALADMFGCDLCLIHVVEPQPISDPTYGAVLPYDVEWNGQMILAAQESLAKMAEGLDVPQEYQWVELGNPSTEIVRVATEQGIDLIVIGTHGRRGLGVLLGSTASSVVHHASCDVLTVRLADA